MKTKNNNRVFISSSALEKLLHYLKSYKMDLAIVTLSLLSVSLALLMLGISFKYLVDQGLTDNKIDEINNAVTLMGVLILVFSASSFFRSYFINSIAEKVVSRIRIDAYSKLLSIDVAHFEELKIGDVISRLTSDLDIVSRLIIDFLSFFIRNSVMLIGAVALMFLQNQKLALMVVVTIPLLLIPLIALAKYVRILAKSVLELKGNVASNIEETLTNIRTLHAFNQQNNKVIDFTDKTNFYLKREAKRLKIRSLFFALAILVILFAIAVVIWIGATDIAMGETSSGEMISFIYYAIIAGTSAGGIAEMFSEIQSPLSALERVFALTELNSSLFPHHGDKARITEKSYSNKTLDISNKPLAIELENVTFSYPSRADLLVLDNVSFKVNTGQFIGIAGRSGAGKSSIMQLLLKFYYPASGIVKVAGQDVSICDTAAVRQLIAYVPQDPSIFSGSITSNIALSRPTASNEEIITAAEAAGIIEFANQLPYGLNTSIGEKGVRLSGGQKQRIAIARALLYKPQILLLDEATSALDRESEHQVLELVKKHMKGNTIISIAHRLSTIEHADEIIVIDKGRIVAKGEHHSLLKESELYCILYQEHSEL